MLNLDECGKAYSSCSHFVGHRHEMASSARAPFQLKQRPRTILAHGPKLYILGAVA